MAELSMGPSFPESSSFFVVTPQRWDGSCYTDLVRTRSLHMKQERRKRSITHIMRFSGGRARQAVKKVGKWLWRAEKRDSFVVLWVSEEVAGMVPPTHMFVFTGFSVSLRAPPHVCGFQLALSPPTLYSLPFRTA